MLVRNNDRTIYLKRPWQQNFANMKLIGCKFVKDNKQRGVSNGKGILEYKNQKKCFFNALTVGANCFRHEILIC